MYRTMRLLGRFLLLLLAVGPSQAQQIGKFVAIPAGSGVDNALTEINAATDPTQKLALLDKYAAELGQGDFAIIFDEQYVNLYLAQKNYDKAFEYGEKLFAADPDSLSNAVSMVRAAGEKGDADKLMTYGEHGGFSGPGPIGPLPADKAYLEYAISMIAFSRKVVAASRSRRTSSMLSVTGRRCGGR